MLAQSGANSGSGTITANAPRPIVEAAAGPAKPAARAEAACPGHRGQGRRGGAKAAGWRRSSSIGTAVVA
eukprot:2975305-Lingulodinium_polyedra.AAC.1